jgi:(p)ppGpp synthase/HD superfamily hydrolase
MSSVKVKVIDALMGTGKTQRMIHDMADLPEDVCIIYITPLLSETEQVVAILHDVFEDCEVDENDVINVFGEEVCKSCMALTRRKGERYGDYLKRVAEDDVATFVKMADISVNFEKCISTGQMERANKYRLKRLQLCFYKSQSITE